MFNLLLIFLLIFTLYRLVTCIAFKPGSISASDAVPSFLMGIRYDLRWIAFILLPIVLFSLWPKLSPFYSARNKKWWTWYLAVVTFIVFVFFAAGFGSFSYNKTPLDAGAMNFAEDFRISWKMMKQTYPLFWMLLGCGGRFVFPLDVPPQSLAGDQPDRWDGHSLPAEVFCTGSCVLFSFCMGQPFLAAAQQE